MVMARDKTTHSKCQEGTPMGSQVQFICVCNYLGEHSCWEPKSIPSSLEHHHHRHYQVKVISEEA